MEDFTMEGYNFLASRIDTLEKEIQQLKLENSWLKNVIEELSTDRKSSMFNKSYSSENIEILTQHIQELYGAFESLNQKKPYRALKY